MKGEDLKQMIDECMDNAYQDKQGKTHLPTFCMVKKLRNKFGDTYAIITDPVEQFTTDRVVTVNAKILKDGKLISSGMASVNRIEKDAVEIAETKAVGRALSFFGMLVDSVAPKESMEHYEQSMGVKGSYVFKPAPTSNDVLLDDPLPTTSKDGVVNVESIKEKLLKAPTLSKLNDLWNRVHRQEIDTLIKNSKTMYGEVYNTFNHRRAEIKRQGDI